MRFGGRGLGREMDREEGNDHLSTQPPYTTVITSVRVLEMGKPRHAEVSNTLRRKSLVGVA